MATRPPHAIVAGMKTLCIGLLLCSTILSGIENPMTQKWVSVADNLVTTAPESYPFDWGEGVQMSGLMQVYERTKTPAYADFVQRWAAFHIPRGVDVLLGNTTDSKRQGYCGHWVSGTALVYLYEATKKGEYLETASRIAGFIRAGATRSPEGAPAHWLGNFQIWVDTLNMTCPLLSKLAKIENKPDYLDDAANQLLVSARHMQDKQTGLFYHMWDWQYDKHSPVQWGRGNGWVMMSLADTFEYLPKTHPAYKPLRQLAESYARSLLAVQDKDGLWHTVITDPHSYAECSAVTMITYGLLKMVRLGVLPARYREPAKMAWAAVNARWVKDGLVTGVSGGTGPTEKDAYLIRPQGTYTWGTGSYLMAGSEIDRLR
jgi:unsaturated rhamnogalacturonyl hydrolase